MAQFYSAAWFYSILFYVFFLFSVFVSASVCFRFVLFSDKIAHNRNCAFAQISMSAAHRHSRNWRDAHKTHSPTHTIAIAMKIDACEARRVDLPPNALLFFNRVAAITTTIHIWVLSESKEEVGRVNAFDCTHICVRHRDTCVVCGRQWSNRCVCKCENDELRVSCGSGKHGWPHIKWQYIFFFGLFCLFFTVPISVSYWLIRDSRWIAYQFARWNSVDFFMCWTALR